MSFLSPGPEIPVYTTTEGRHTTTKAQHPKGPKFHMLSPEQEKVLRQLKAVVELLRNIEPRMPTSYADAFLSIALRPGEGPTGYAKYINTIQPITSRILAEIGARARRRDQALELVDRQADPETLRKHEYFLTPKGKHLLTSIFKAMGVEETTV